VAGILTQLGIPLSDDPAKLSDPDFGNPKGQFEDKELTVINNRILEHADAKWWYEIPDPEKIEKVANESGFEDFIRKVIAKRDNAADVWAAKDPRFTVTYPLIRPFLRNPHVIYCGRSMEQTILSLRRVFKYVGMAIPAEPYTFWATVSIRCLNYLFSLEDPLFVLSFERMMKTPERTAKDIAKFVGKKMTELAYDWIDPNLQTITDEGEKEE